MLFKKNPKLFFSLFLIGLFLGLGFLILDTEQVSAAWCSGNEVWDSRWEPCCTTEWNYCCYQQSYWEPNCNWKCQWNRCKTTESYWEPNCNWKCQWNSCKTTESYWEPNCNWKCQWNSCKTTERYWDGYCSWNWRRLRWEGCWQTRCVGGYDCAWEGCTKYRCVGGYDCAWEGCTKYRCVGGYDCAWEGCTKYRCVGCNECKGCSQDYKVKDCGASSYCSGGQCIPISCASGRGNCDGIASNGCETNLLTSNSNCGACGNSCSSGYGCINGTCIYTAGYNGAACCEDTNYCTNTYSGFQSCLKKTPPTCSVSCGTAQPGDCTVRPHNTGKICYVTYIDPAECTAWGPWANCHLEPNGLCYETRFCKKTNLYQIRQCSCIPEPSYTPTPTPTPTPTLTPTPSPTPTPTPTLTPTPSPTPTPTPNSPPIASFSCSPSTCSIYTGEILTLNNSSFDPDNNLARSEWDILNWGSAPDLTCCAFGCDSTTILCNYTVQSLILGRGTYSAKLTVKDALNETASLTKTFYIKQDAIADFKCSHDNSFWANCQNFEAKIGDKVYFLSQSFPSEGATITSWSWVFQDATPSAANTSNPQTKFRESGIKTVSLTIQDSAGRSASKSYNLKIQMSLPEWEEIAPF